MTNGGAKLVGFEGGVSMPKVHVSVYDVENGFACSTYELQGQWAPVGFMSDDCRFMFTRSLWAEGDGEAWVRCESNGEMPAKSVQLKMPLAWATSCVVYSSGLLIALAENIIYCVPLSSIVASSATPVHAQQLHVIREVGYMGTSSDYGFQGDHSLELYGDKLLINRKIYKLTKSGISYGLAEIDDVSCIVSNMNVFDLSEDGNLLVTTSRFNSSVRVFDIASKQLCYELPYDKTFYESFYILNSSVLLCIQQSGISTWGVSRLSSEAYAPVVMKRDTGRKVLFGGGRVFWLNDDYCEVYIMRSCPHLYEGVTVSHSEFQSGLKQSLAAVTPFCEDTVGIIVRCLCEVDLNAIHSCKSRSSQSEDKDDSKGSPTKPVIQGKRVSGNKRPFSSI